MVYIYEENLPFYNSIKNKSEWVNDKLQDARIDTRIKDETTDMDTNNPVETPTAPEIQEENDPDYHPDPRIRDTRRQLREMEARDNAFRNNS